MIDKKHVDMALDLMKKSGVLAYCVICYDKEQHSLILGGTREDLIAMFANALDDDDLREIIKIGVKINLVKSMLKGGEK